MRTGGICRAQRGLTMDRRGRYYAGFSRTCLPAGGAWGDGDDKPPMEA
jgi:hypothetical protein